jgi:WD40 repeat protein
MIWYLESGDIKCRLTTYDAFGRAVAFSPDSHYLLAGSQDPIAQTGQLILWDVQTCKLVRQFDTHEDIAGIAFSADGTRAITGAGYYGRAILWDVATGKEIKRYTYPFQGGPVLGVAFGPGESTILGSGEAGLYLWDVKSAEIIRRYIGHSPWPWTLDLSSDYRYVISAGQDGNLILWDFTTGEELHRLSFSMPVQSTVFSPDGKIVYAAVEDGKLLEWHLAEKSLPELLDWIKSNRYVRDLTCEERLQFHVDPLCSQK